jgi:hypothetical protein
VAVVYHSLEWVGKGLAELRRTELFRELLADHHRPVQLIHRLEDLQLQIMVEGRRSQVLMHLGLGRRR